MVDFWQDSDPICGRRELQPAYFSALLQKHFGPKLAVEASASMRSGSAVVLRIDHGLKNSKRVRTEGERAFEATCTVMNERGYILGIFHGGTGLHDLKAPLLLLRRRIEQMGQVRAGLPAVPLLHALLSCIPASHCCILAAPMLIFAASAGCAAHLRGQLARGRAAARGALPGHGGQGGPVPRVRPRGRRAARCAPSQA